MRLAATEKTSSWHTKNKSAVMENTIFIMETTTDTNYFDNNKIIDTIFHTGNFFLYSVVQRWATIL